MHNIVKIIVLSLFVSNFCHSASASDTKAGLEAENKRIRPPSLSLEQNQTENFMPTGSVISFAGMTAPQGWLLCNGQIVSRSEFKKLYDVIGRTYTPVNHNPPLGESLFCVPDMRGRTSVGTDTNANRVTANNTLGASSGEEKHSLTIEEMPKHNHKNISGTANRNSYNSSQESAYHVPMYSNHYDDNPNNFALTKEAGNDKPHNNMPPYLTLNYIIKH